MGVVWDYSMGCTSPLDSWGSAWGFSRPRSASAGIAKRNQFVSLFLCLCGFHFPTGGWPCTALRAQKAVRAIPPLQSKNDGQRKRDNPARHTQEQNMPFWSHSDYCVMGEAKPERIRVPELRAVSEPERHGLGYPFSINESPIFLCSSSSANPWG